MCTLAVENRDPFGRGALSLDGGGREGKLQWLWRPSRHRVHGAARQLAGDGMH
jgi:hypothetical protein